MKTTSIQDGICIDFEGTPSERSIAEMKKRKKQIDRFETMWNIIGFLYMAGAVSIFLLIILDIIKLPSSTESLWGLLICFVLIITGISVITPLRDHSPKKIEYAKLECTMNRFDAYNQITAFTSEYTDVKSSFIVIGSVARISLFGEMIDGDIKEEEVKIPLESYIYNSKIKRAVLNVTNGTLKIPEDMKNE